LCADHRLILLLYIGEISSNHLSWAFTWWHLNSPGKYYYPNHYWEIVNFCHQALIEARKPHSIHKSLLDATKGTFFFGTPHQGLRTEELEEMAKDLISDSSDTTDLLRKLRAGSEFLESQSEELVEILDGKKVVSFYELLGTQTVKKVRIASTFTWQICIDSYPSPRKAANMKDPGISKDLSLRLQLYCGYDRRYAFRSERIIQISSSSLLDPIRHIYL
jgi:hypothetical protein